MTEPLEFRTPRVLMPAYTVADWGGLHENVLFAAKACLGHGWSVTAVVRPGQFSQALRDSGADVVEVEWSRWKEFIPTTVANGPYDLIFTQPFTSRKMALEMGRLTGAPLVAMFHGFNHDYLYMWQDRTEAIAVTADVLKDFLVEFCRISAEKITVIPNGIPVERFDVVPTSGLRRTADGELHVLLASRLTPDKRSQIEVLQKLIHPLADCYPEHRIIIDVLGGGPEEMRIRSVLSSLAARHSNVEGRMHGWVDARDIPRFLDRSYVSITAGRAGLQSMVSGTPTIAAGARGVVGPAWGDNRDAAISSNFGDYPIRGRRKWSYEQLVADLADNSRYTGIQHESRTALYDRMQSTIDAKLLDLLSRHASQLEST